MKLEEKKQQPKNPPKAKPVSGKKRENGRDGPLCRRRGSEKQLARACLQSVVEGERDNIFGGLEAGNKKAAPNKEENAKGPAGAERKGERDY